MGRLIGEIPEPDPAAEFKVPAWFHQPADVEKYLWLQEEHRKCRARVDELRAGLYAELTRDQWERLFGLVLAIQYAAVAERMMFCMTGYGCDEPDLGLSSKML